MKYSILSLLLLTSCASILNGSKQEVSIRTEPSVPANCKIDGSDFNAEIEAPAKVTIQKSYYPTNITCSANGQTGSVKVLSDVSNWGYGGAVAGLGVGSGVDTYTGAAYEYPSEIVVKLGEDTIIGRTKMNDNVDWK